MDRDAERTVRELEQKVRQDWVSHGRVWVNKECFEQCLPTIRPWIDINSLMGHLVQRGIVNDQDDHHQLQNYVDPPGVKVVKLLGLAEKAGPYGYYLLYMCIRDTRDDQMGHGDAARELQRYASKHKLQPPAEISST